MAYKFPEKIYSNTLNAYIQCPFKFKCSNDKEVKAEFIESAENFIGKAIHLVLRNLFDISNIPINERKNQDLGIMLRCSWARIPKNDWSSNYWSADERIKLFGSVEQEKAFGLRAIGMLKNYISSADLSAVPISLEDWMECSIGGLKIAGRIDRIDQDSESSISVWDYKTGKLPYHDSIEKKMDEDLQIPIYAIIASKLNPFAEKIRAGLIFIKYSKIYDITWTKEELQGVENRVIDTVSKAKGDIDFQPRVNKLCPWCEYIKYCPSKNMIEGKEKKVDEVGW